MEKELNIIPPIGYEIDKQKSTFEKIIFKKIPKTPKTWEEYCELTKGNPSFYVTLNAVDTNKYSGEYNEFSTRERAVQFIALGKLLQLRDCWVKGYNEFRYALFGTKINIIICEIIGFSSYSLTFPTKEMAKEFQECFGDLVKQAFPLV